MVGLFLYSIVIFSLLLATAMYFTRSRWIPHVPGYVYERIPTSFMDDVEGGLTSTDFDLASNITSGDSRAGLDEAGKREVKKIMKKKKVNFDEARRLYNEQRFAKNNIGPDGIPRDAKFVSFS